MADWDRRFEAKVDRSGECHLWTGARTAAGVGQMRINGKLRTAAQLASELEHGELPPGSRIRYCGHNKLCVRVDHLQLDTPSTSAERTEQRQRAERGSGSMREVTGGKWKLTIDAGRDTRGRRRRVTKTMSGSRREAAQALAALTAEVQSGKRRPTASPET